MGDCGQQLVADGVAEAVIDRLELVDIEEQQAHQPPASSMSGKGVLQPVLEQRSVGRSGQVVVERLDDQALLQRPALRDVGKGAGHAEEPTVIVVDGARVDLDPTIGRFCGPRKPKFAAICIDAAGRDREDQVAMMLPIVRVYEIEDGPSEALGDAVMRELLPRPVEQLPTAFGIDPEDHLAYTFDHGPVAHLALAECLGRSLRTVDRELQSASMAVHHQACQPDDRGHAEDAHERGELRRHVGLGGVTSTTAEMATATSHDATIVTVSRRPRRNASANATPRIGTAASAGTGGGMPADISTPLSRPPTMMSAPRVARPRMSSRRP